MGVQDWALRGDIRRRGKHGLCRQGALAGEASWAARLMGTGRCAGRERRKETAALPVSSPPAAPLPASGEVGSPAWGTPCSSVPCSSPRLPPSWALESVSGFQLAPALGPFPATPRLRPVPHHLLCLHGIQASAVVWFPDHPVSNRDFLSAYTLLLPAFPALLFFTPLVYSVVHCVTACFPFRKVRSSRAGTMSYSSRNPTAKSIAWHM